MHQPIAFAESEVALAVRPANRVIGRRIHPSRPSWARASRRAVCFKDLLVSFSFFFFFFLPFFYSSYRFFFFLILFFYRFFPRLLSSTRSPSDGWYWIYIYIYISRDHVEHSKIGDSFEEVRVKHDRLCIYDRLDMFAMSCASLFLSFFKCN